jgi:hypothetical protein
MRAAVQKWEEYYKPSYQHRRAEMSDTFQDFITRDRGRLHAEREAIFNQQHELEGKLAAINNEMRAIDAYEAAKAGKTAPARPAGMRRTSRARSGSKREQLLQVIREGGGLTRGEILDRMGLKGDKSGEMSVSNALTATSAVRGTAQIPVVHRTGRQAALLRLGGRDGHSDSAGRSRRR